MAQSKHFLLLIHAWGKRSSHSVDREHAPPAASHSPWPRFVPANISEFLLESCSVSWFFSYIIPSFPLFFQLTFCPQTAARSAHTPLVSALLPLSAPPSARGLCLPCSSHQAPLPGCSWTVFGTHCTVLGIPWEDTGPRAERVKESPSCCARPCKRSCCHLKEFPQRVLAPGGRKINIFFN